MRRSWPRIEGLSPPTRGNRIPLPALKMAGGSIPAHAGEPVDKLQRAMKAGVYPRPRGGTSIVSLNPGVPLGLSPPTRGNREPLEVRLPALGSIPAHAGEPHWSCSATRAWRVYPRPRGGTGGGPFVASQGRGLSPPTRGNRRLPRGGGDAMRSIPAHAGEPYA